MFVGHEKELESLAPVVRGNGCFDAIVSVSELLGL